MRSTAWIGLCLVGITLAVFHPTLGYDFIGYDDYPFVVFHPQVRAGLSLESAIDAFTTPYRGVWHPLSVVSFQLDRALWGERGEGYHLTNLALHALNTLLLFSALSRMTGAIGRSAFVAAVFAIHPLHVESVAWIYERKDVLSGLFFMLTLLAYARYVEVPRAGRYGLVLLCLTLGLVAKPMLVTLPFVLLLLDYWPLGRLRGPGGLRDGRALRRVLVEKLPMLVPVAAVAAITFATQTSGKGGLQGLSLPLAIANAIHSYGIYVLKSFWPSGLAVFYPHPVAAIAWIEVAAAAIGIAVVSVASARFAATRPWAPIGWLWYLGTLVPVIGVVQVGLQARADRYMYLPLIGLAILVAWGAVELLGRWPRALVGVGAAVVAALSAVAAQQVPYWRDSTALFERALQVTERNYIAHASLSAEMLNQDRLEEAEFHAREAVRFGPDYFQPQFAMARLAERQGNLAELIRRYQIMLEIAPDAPDIVTVHHELGFALIRALRFRDARPHLERVLAEHRDWPHVHVGLALVAEHEKEWDVAVRRYREALRLYPGLRFAVNNLARLLCDCERVPACDPREAVRISEAAVAERSRPDPVLLGTLAAAYRAAGRTADAERTAAQAAQAARARRQPLHATSYPLSQLFHELGVRRVVATD